jgi:formimidoylglutamate deiminase
MNTRSLFASDALLPDGWARNVLLSWDEHGRFASLLRDTARPTSVPKAAGPVIPGMPNLHSHAFQRAFAGLSEYRATPDDSFWSWRELMYGFAAHLTPNQLEAIATWLYVEMLEAGYTSVCEFHYLHHDREGTPYADEATLALCLLRAAERAGIGLTLLPVLYQRAGFGHTQVAANQRRFVRTTESLLALVDRLKPICDSYGVRLGFAAHSLRAVPPESLRDALAGLDAIDATAPIHIHIAEQLKEVSDCLAWSRQRPVEWLLDHAAVDARWCLVHATHMTRDESRRASRTGAVAGLCPTTEANLGDGIFNMPAWLEWAGPQTGRWGIGSDSHCCVNAAEELLQLEYGQRLHLHRRNVLGSIEQPDVAAAMMLAAVAGGAQASGRTSGGDAGLAVGQRADFVVLDATHPLVAELSAAQMLSVHVFASHRESVLSEVWVEGRRQVSAGRHPLHDTAARAFVAARAQLLASVPVALTTG